MRGNLLVLGCVIGLPMCLHGASPVSSAPDEGHEAKCGERCRPVLQQVWRVVATRLLSV